MRKSLIISAICLFLAGLELWVFGRPAYRHHKEERFIKQAKKYMAESDFRNAALAARQAFALNPGNVDACGILAELSELAQSAQLLDWRRRLADLAPTVENRLLLARAALRCQPPPYPLAAPIPSEIDGSGQDIAAFHVVSAELALKLNEPTKAADEFAEASRLEPTNEMHRLNLAVLRLQSSNLAASSSARAIL